MQKGDAHLREAARNVRRCTPGAFCVVALTHVPYLLLLLSVLSALFAGDRYHAAALVGAFLFLAVIFFAALPMSVALSGYFIALAKGRYPRVMSIFCVFSDTRQYRHALSAMLFVSAKVALWVALALSPLLLTPFLPPRALPVFLCLCALLALCAFFNRLLSYAFTAHFAWEYPYLTPREALRLSLHVTRGRLLSLLRALFPLIVALALSAPTLGFLSLIILPFFYALLAGCYLHFKQCEGVLLPSPKEYADV